MIKNPDPDYNTKQGPQGPQKLNSNHLKFSTLPPKIREYGMKPSDGFLILGGKTVKKI